jgi:hypothetical protein
LEQDLDPEEARAIVAVCGSSMPRCANCLPDDDDRRDLQLVHRWFTEGFDTADLKDAKALRDELGRSASSVFSPRSSVESRRWNRAKKKSS